MTEEPWPIDESRHQPPSYPLNGKDRLYCVTGDVIRPSDTRRRIRERRIEKLPDRFQDLFDDLALIHYSDEEFLEQEEWDRLWEEILETENRMSTVSENEILGRGGPPNTREVEFGFQLGYLVRKLASTDSSKIELLWGFLLGCFGGDMPDFETEGDILSMILNQLENWKDERYEYRDSEVTSRRGFDEISESRRTPVKRRLNKHLEAHDIDVDVDEVDYLRKVVSRFAPILRERDRDHLVSAEVDFEKFGAVHELVESVTADIETIQNWEKHGADASVILENIYDEAVVSLSTDQYRVVEEGGDGERPVSHMEPFSVDQIPVSKSNISSISNEYGTFITNILRRSSVQPDYELYVSRPIFDGEEEDWTFTRYGLLLAYTVFEREDPGWIYHYLDDDVELRQFDEDLIEATLEEQLLYSDS